MLKNKIRKRFDKMEIELVDVSITNLWGHFKHAVLLAYDEMCGKRSDR